ncbi:hypothetical protein J3E72DRAFT_408872 [Bipolaris maydis]|nr:hypothetical protein J3E72DRAFT_413423 [Bipolaris maydis]KAJ6192240.1 hypothetical protein J3E72DRAFT_408872 [Bipolaris maydis]
MCIFLVEFGQVLCIIRSGLPLSQKYTHDDYDFSLKNVIGRESCAFNCRQQKRVGLGVHLRVIVNSSFISDSAYFPLVVWIFWAISLVYGLGRSFRVLDDNEISNTQLYFFLSYVFLNIPIALSKISFFLLVKRIFAQTESISGRVLGSTIGLITAWCIASSFVVLLSCSRATLLPNAGAEYCVDSVSVSMKCRYLANANYHDRQLASELLPHWTGFLN